MQHYTRPDARLAKARRLGFQAWRKRDEAERLAIPPREPEPVPGQEVYRITVECAGSMHIITAHWPRASGVRRPRSDQFRVVDDGVVSDVLEGRTAILERVGGHLCRMLTRAERARLG